MIKIILLAFTLAFGFSCQDSFITDEKYLATVESDFKTRKDSLSNTTYFDIFKTDKLSKKQREAMMFLYAYMPLGDISDYPSDLYLKSVDATLTLKKKLPWVELIPEEVFRHFVLPIRVNNEYLDSARYTLFQELYPRVKNMSMHDAALEVNHWCHEKVVYKPSDSRTSSPLATIKTAHGRCGEESVFAVAALRAVGIPARQVYTPRWAHTDDNHAWVEVWIDGKWSYMGACEPEPELNIAWFSKTVQRGILMHTKAFGKYNGAEQKMLHTPNFTEINVTENYTPTVSNSVTVMDEDGNAVEGADVSFRIYNYGQFFPVFSQKTLINGKSEIISGKGDLFVWATKGDRFGYKILSANKTNSITILLDKKIGDVISENIDITPPVDGKDEVLVSSEQIAKNAERLKQEDKIRGNYIATFITSDMTRRMASELGYNPNLIENFVIKSRGNWSEIASFLRSANGQNKKVNALLNTLLEKDLRDIKANELSDHLNNSPSTIYSTLYNNYVLAPRVSDELITPYKKQLQELFGESLVAKFKKKPEELVKWVDQNIRINNSENSINVPISPVGVYTSKYADEHSRDIFFVASCRSFGIPARLEMVTGKVQFYHRNLWHNVYFGNKKRSTTPNGYLRLKYKEQKTLGNPLYDTHFTISKIVNGIPKLLNFRNMGGFEGTASYKTTFSKPVRIEEGYYMLTTGRRMASGKVLSAVKMFNIIGNKTTKVELLMREDINDISVIGNLNPEALLMKEGDNKQKSILSQTGRGYFVLAILGAKQEPTSHLLRDIIPFKNQFEKWDREMVMLFKNSAELGNFDKTEFPDMPTNMTFGVDVDEKITDMLCKNMKIHNRNSLPIVVIADTFGRIVYFSQGYTTGQGEQLINVINKL